MNNSHAYMYRTRETQIIYIINYLHYLHLNIYTKSLNQQGNNT